MAKFDIYMPSDHYKIYGEYVPYEDEHEERWVDDNGRPHAEIICDKCGETRYFRDKSPMARAIIWRATHHETGFNGCSCQQATKNRAQRRRDEYDSTPEYTVTEKGEKVLVRNRRDFIQEHMFDWKRNLVAINSHIPQDVVTSRINDRTFMQPSFSYLARKELRRICEGVLANGISSCENLYITGKGKCEKTRALYSLRNAMLEGTVDAVYTNVDQIISVMLAGSDYIGTLICAECLLIDDIGKRKLSQSETLCIVNFIKTLKFDRNHYCIMAGVPVEQTKDISPEIYNTITRHIEYELWLNDEN